MGSEKAGCRGGLEVEMNIRRLCIWRGVTASHFPTFGYEMSGQPQKFAPRDKNKWMFLMKLCKRIKAANAGRSLFQ